MLSASIKSLILDEQARQSNRFIEGVEMDAYLAKLSDRAEILSDSVAGRCRGFVAYYCNDLATRRAYITLVLVDPRDRRVGLAVSLIACVLSIAKQRGFTSCRLEVSRSNQAAHEMYLSQGFRVIEERAGKYLSEINF
jgi:ribosomal protein S18 acetylase RimI-like enzyme